ncbi:MAG: hypothetical protein ACMG6E_08185, partial [Candidatus Roizmanbacteria bacterium]
MIHLGFTDKVEDSFALMPSTHSLVVDKSSPNLKTQKMYYLIVSSNWENMVNNFGSAANPYGQDIEFSILV